MSNSLWNVGFVLLCAAAGALCAGLFAFALAAVIVLLGLTTAVSDSTSAVLTISLVGAVGGVLIGLLALVASYAAGRGEDETEVFSKRTKGGR